VGDRSGRLYGLTANVTNGRRRRHATTAGMNELLKAPCESPPIEAPEAPIRWPDPVEISDWLMAVAVMASPQTTQRREPPTSSTPCLDGVVVRKVSAQGEVWRRLIAGEVAGKSLLQS
jgi:hypothetical protein